MKGELSSVWNQQGLMGILTIGGMSLNLKILSETFDCYSFAKFEALAEQKLKEPSFICSVRDDYSLMAVTDTPVTGFVEVETGWVCIAIDDELPFDLTGIAASITNSLASADISVLVMSGFRTDYFFIKTEFVERAVSCLKNAGHDFLS